MVLRKVPRSLTDSKPLPEIGIHILSKIQDSVYGTNSCSGESLAPLSFWQGLLQRIKVSNKANLDFEAVPVARS